MVLVVCGCVKRVCVCVVWVFTQNALADTQTSLDAQTSTHTDTDTHIHTDTHSVVSNYILNINNDNVQFLLTWKI